MENVETVLSMAQQALRQRFAILVERRQMIAVAQRNIPCALS